MSAARLIFLGAPGTGKGTQARRMSERFGLAPLSSGDALRREVQDDSPLGRRVARTMERGELVSDDVITQVMLAAIQGLPAGKGFILDGYPRTVPQADALNAGLARVGAKLDAVVDFAIADDLVLARIAQRSICSGCGASYNDEFVPPRTAGRCDNCGKALTRRPDDRAEVVATRLEAYRRQTAPLIEYYEARGLLLRVDAGASPDAVEAQVVSAIEAIG